MLYTKSIIKPASPEDGIRISVMSRHTLDDGITPDVRITPESYDEHLQSLAPPAKLVGDYYKRGLSWEDYEIRYLEYLRQPENFQVVRHLAERAVDQDITLLCIEETAERCHRRLLAEECKRHNNFLVIRHN